MLEKEPVWHHADHTGATVALSVLPSVFSGFSSDNSVSPGPCGSERKHTQTPMLMQMSIDSPKCHLLGEKPPGMILGVISKGDLCHTASQHRERSPPAVEPVLRRTAWTPGLLSTNVMHGNDRALQAPYPSGNSLHTTGLERDRSCREVGTTGPGGRQVIPFGCQVLMTVWRGKMYGTCWG